MINLKEKDIVANWCHFSKPVVSVQCFAYNHISFIAQAIDGFLMQRTDFPFEIVVHDDASTDGTADVIREYEKEFPQIIKPIYEKENQYSKRNGSLERIINKACKGKYVTFCEGDDYWTDCDKLQKQFNFLEAHPEYVACSHNTLVVEMGKKMKNRLMFPQKDIVLTINDMKERYHVSSLMCRSSAYFDTPFFLTNSSAPGDVKMAAYLKSKGSIFRSAEVMSAYRHGTPGSWTINQSKSKDVFANRRNVILFYEEFDKWTNYKYPSISYRINQLRLDLVLKQGHFFEAKRKYSLLFDELSVREKIRYFLIALKKRIG